MELKKLVRQSLLPENSKSLLSIACFICGLLSIGFSLGIFFISNTINENTDINKFIVLFIGLWAPTLISIANFFKK